MSYQYPFREQLIDAILDFRNQFPRDPDDASSDEIADIVLDLVAGRLQKLADQVPPGVCRDALLAEIAHMRGAA